MKKIPFLLDGAMGTELNNRGVKTALPLWTADANILHPHLVQNIHSEYIYAGADYITTNTFRSTSWTYKRAGYTNAKAKMMAKKSLYSGVKCAQNASKGVVKVAGSITTLDDCYTPESFPDRNIALDVYRQTLDWLIDAGVDVILFETMGNIEEIEIALSLSTEYSKSIWLSVIMKDSKTILDGTRLENIFSLAKQYSVHTLLLNCNEISKTINAIKDFHHFWDGLWGVYPNLGVKDYSNNYFDIINNTKLIQGIKNILEHNPTIIGCCCGSSPMHIKILKKQIIKEYENAFEN
jgi:S-methylmethionine-dependent homocysteine/selenocysteine methylase